MLKKITPNNSFYFYVILGLTVFSSLSVGILGGQILAFTHNLDVLEVFEKTKPALPSRILDRHGNLVTELFSDEKREILSVEEMSSNISIALMTREDQYFLHHNGLSVQGTARAIINILLGRFVSGGSTLTQQVAGYIYADRREYSLKRKISELWWAWNLEKMFTKEEILELYINYVPFGHTTYGVEAASQYFFNHSARTMTPVEASILVIQLSSPGRNSPYRNPERAKERSSIVLRQINEAGYFTKEEIASFVEDYWENNRIWTKSSSDNAYSTRTDNAPYFTEYIRSLMLSLLKENETQLYKGGLNIHTTLDLDMQQKAHDTVTTSLYKWNKSFNRQAKDRNRYASQTLVPMLELLGFSVNLKKINLGIGVTKNQQKDSLQYLSQEISPTIELLSQIFGLQKNATYTNDAHKYVRSNAQESLIQSALVTLDNETGGIRAMIGGSEFSSTNQFNRALHGRLQPGSTFKPLFYSEAIASHKFTVASHIVDVPRVFINPDGSRYQPSNYLGELKGDVLLRTALSRSMNIPAVYILSQIGFDLAIDRAAAFLGLTKQEDIDKALPRVYPLALGVTSVSPMQLARAYTVFPELGIAHDTYAIDNITNMNGEFLYNFNTPEEKAKRTHQIMDQASSYIMVNLLQSTVTIGTLRNPISRAGGFDFPAAGKTGTTQNWADAWTAGFSPIYTTVMWAGFDRPGNSLGRNLTGSTATGIAWANYMKEIHANIPDHSELAFKFPDDENSIIYVDVSTKTGLLPTENTRGVTREIFIKGTEPTEYSLQENFEAEQRKKLLERMKNSSNRQSYSTENNFDIGDYLNLNELETQKIEQEETTKQPTPDLLN